MIIAVWGNSGAGKSTVASKIAIEMSKRGKNTVLIDTNFFAPQTKVWFPRSDITQAQSLSVILANNISEDKVAPKISKVNDRFGYLGYARDLAINSVPSRDDTPQDLLTTLEVFTDVIVVDCQSNITQDIMSFVSLDVADTKVICMTPDLRGLSWYEANVMMFKEKWVAQGTHILPTFSKVKINSPAEAMEKIIGDVEYYFPFFDELEEELYVGTIGTEKYKGRSKKYEAIIKSLCDYILKTYETRKESLKAQRFMGNTSEQAGKYDVVDDMLPQEEIKDIFNYQQLGDGMIDVTNIPPTYNDQQLPFAQDNEFSQMYQQAETSSSPFASNNSANQQQFSETPQDTNSSSPVGAQDMASLWSEFGLDQ